MISVLHSALHALADTEVGPSAVCDERILPLASPSQDKTPAGGRRPDARSGRELGAGFSPMGVSSIGCHRGTVVDLASSILARCPPNDNRMAGRK